MREMPTADRVDETLAARLRQAKARSAIPLEGGVSSDIRLVEVDGERYCIKQALATLKVAADWRAPVARNHSEAEWLRTVHAIVPSAAPEVLFEDRREGWFAMRYLPPEHHALWKSQLRDGTIIVADAAAVGDVLAEIHSATANRNDIAEQFANDGIFFPIRVDPYLIATAKRHPGVAGRLQLLANTLMATKRALVHGDVSPKNILMGPHGPVFLDAECAWYGDPAFDLAFVLNHLLLKCVWRPHWRDAYLACFASLRGAYLAGVDWEPPDALEARTAALLPGLLLGRIDGKSPVEYIVDERDRAFVRGVARRLLSVEEGVMLPAIADTWLRALRERS